MFSPDKWFGVSKFYNGVATQSLRFEDGSVHKLTKDFTGTTRDNNKKMTISVWAKRGNLTTGTQMVILSTYTAVRFVGELAWDSNSDSISFDPGGNGDGATNAYKVESTAQFRDQSAWYHIVLAYDSTQSTDTDRVKLYVNGTQKTVTAPSGHTFPTLNYVHEFAYAGPNNEIGNYTSVASGPLDGYLADLHFIDGLALDPTYFGETKNGVWIAKQYTGSFGTCGYKLDFKGTGTATSSGNVANPTNIGDDSSGNNHHWAVSGLDSHDCVLDSPENNFATMSDLPFGRTNDNISEGNLKVGATDQHVHASTFGIPTSGKWYWEINSVSSDGSNYYFPYAGVVNSTFFHNYQDETGNVGDNLRNTAGLSYIRGDDTNYKDLTSTSITSGANKANENTTTYEQGILGLALDSDAGTLKYYWNNSLSRTDSTLTAGDQYFPYNFGTNTGSNNWNFNYYNFGQDSSFAGTKTAQGNKDANGNGDFYYSPPTDHLALCTDNLPEPSLGPNSPEQPNDYFNIVRYSGNGSTQSITGVGFAPDLVWIKKESGGTGRNAIMTDTARGVTKCLSPALNDGEFTNSGGVTAFGTDGFSVGSYDSVNESGNSDLYNSWNWRASAGVVTATAAEAGNNPGYSQYAQPTAGFSIIKYVGTQAAGTIPHGLGAVPEWIILKNLDIDGNSWIVYHGANTTAPETDFLRLEDTHATADNANRFNDTAPTSSVFTVGADSNINDDGQNCIAYVWTPIPGFSKFGIYEGNGDADGTFVYTGFSPAWVMVKRTDSTDNWQIFNNKIDVINPHFSSFFSDTADHMATYGSARLDFVSNGFKLRLNFSSANASGGDYVYMAFAEQPFKYANAR